MQIGAVLVDIDAGFREIAAFATLVQPSVNPVLSDYFTDLTGITNDALMLDAVDLSDGLSAFATFAADHIILSHGRDDLVIGEDCALKDLDNPFAGRDWRDINPPIRALTDKRLASSELPAQFGLEATGPAHDALADARALARVLGHLRENGRV